MMEMILFKNADSDRFGKLQKEIHDDHLKNQDKSVSKYPKTTAGVLRLLNHHSKSEKKQTQRCKPKETEVAFAQGDDDRPRGFGHRKGKCRICNKEGHHG